MVTEMKWVYGVILTAVLPNEELRQRLGFEGNVIVLQCNKL